jgi:transcriptional regulator with XRE-family HTH domain
MAGSIYEPIRIPDWAWSREEIHQSLRVRDVAGIFRFAQRYGGATQGRLAGATGIAQGRISEILKGDRQVSALEVFERVADGLNMPNSARIQLGLAPAHDHDRLPEAANEILCVFPAQEHATEDIQALVPTATSIDILAVRGLGILGLNSSLLRSTLPADLPNAGLAIRAALLDPSCEHSKRRAAEIGESPQSFSRGIELAVELIQDLSRQKRLTAEVYLYRRLPVWRIINIDGIIFASSFSERWEGHEARTYKLMPASAGSLHSGFCRFFDEIRESSKRII